MNKEFEQLVIITLKSMQNEIDNLKNEIRELKTDIARLKNESAQLKQSIADIKNNTTQGDDDEFDLDDFISKL